MKDRMPSPPRYEDDDSDDSITFIGFWQPRGWISTIHTMKINEHTDVKVSLKIKKHIWNKRVFVSGCTRTNPLGIS